MSTDGTETETPKRARKPRQRISYADRCQEHERDKASMQAKLGTVLVLLGKVMIVDSCIPVMEAAIGLIREMRE